MTIDFHSDANRGTDAGRGADTGWADAMTAIVDPAGKRSAPPIVEQDCRTIWSAVA